MKHLHLLPVFNEASGFYRIFGNNDKVESTQVVAEPSILQPLLTVGPVTFAVRYIAPVINGAVIQKTRFEVYSNGVLLDYTMDRRLALKTFRFVQRLIAA